MNLDKQLANLLEYQGQVLELRRLEQQAAKLKAGLEIESLREQLLEKSTELSANLARSESLLRDKRRVVDEQQLVQKRLDQDQLRLKTTAVSRDAIALKHEIETLNKRASVLSEELTGIEHEIDMQNEVHHRIEREREVLEQELELAKARVKLELDELRENHSAIKASSQTLRDGLDPILIAEFDRRAERGIAVGVLRKSTCGACNMSLTSTALSGLLSAPTDQLIHCPECSAILVRE